MRRMASLVACLLGGCIFFPSVFLIIRKFSYLLFSKDQQNVEASCAAIALRCTSIIQALLAVVLGFCIIRETYEDVIFSRCMLVDVYASFAVPYMIYDIGAMYIVHREETQSNDASDRTMISSFLRKQFVLVSHHLGIAFVFYPLVMFLRNGKGDFVIGCFFLAELSTPAMNIRTILIKLELGDTLFYRLNNVVFLVSFFVCRILLFPFLYWAYSRNKQLSIYDTLSSMKAVCHVGCAVLLAMQIMWYAKFLKVVRRERKVRDSSPSKWLRNTMQDNNHAALLVHSNGKAD